jgi:hypothetical protein
VGTLDQGAHRGVQRIGLTRWQPGHGAGEQGDAEHLPIPAQGLVTGGCQPDQCPPPVPRIVLALQQAVALQMGHDLADHRLRPAHVRRSLADGERTG